MARILRFPEIKARTGLSRSTIYLMIRTGRFPTQIQIGKRAVGWDSQSVDEWIDERIRSAAEVGRK